jgi:hypothetical protein
MSEKKDALIELHAAEGGDDFCEDKLRERGIESRSFCAVGQHPKAQGTDFPVTKCWGCGTLRSSPLKGKCFVACSTPPYMSLLPGGDKSSCHGEWEGSSKNIWAAALQKPVCYAPQSTEKAAGEKRASLAVCTRGDQVIVTNDAITCKVDADCEHAMRAYDHASALYELSSSGNIQEKGAPKSLKAPETALSRFKEREATSCLSGGDCPTQTVGMENQQCSWQHHPQEDGGENSASAARGNGINSKNRKAFRVSDIVNGKAIMSAVSFFHDFGHKNEDLQKRPGECFGKFSLGTHS